MKNLMLISILLLSMISSIEAQLFKRVLDRTADKIEQRVEDKIVEGISNELANRAVRPLDNVYDEIFREQYKATYGKEWDDEEYENDEDRHLAMQKMIYSMYGNVDLPESYTFDYTIEIETYDYGEKKPNKMKMLVSSSQNIFGMEQQEEGNNIIVFDGEKDIMTVYNLADKTATALPNFMGMAGAFAGQTVNEEMSKNVKIEKHKSKKILGYESQGYKVETEDDKSEMYVTNELGFSWRESFGKMLEKSAPNLYNSHDEEYLNGMLMEAKSKRKSDGKESKWETKKIDKKEYIIDNGDYQLANQNMPK